VGLAVVMEEDTTYTWAHTRLSNGLHSLTKISRELETVVPTQIHNSSSKAEGTANKQMPSIALLGLLLRLVSKMT